MTGNKIFYWQYPNESENRIIRAYDYKIIDRQPQFEYTSRRRYGIRAKFYVNGRCPPPEYNNVPTKWANGELAVTYAFGDYTAPIWSVKSNHASSAFARFEIEYTSRNGGSLLADYCIRKTTLVPAYARKSDDTGNVTVENGKSDYVSPGVDPEIGFFDFELIDMGEGRPCLNELPTECTLEFRNAQLETVYSRTEAICPLVTEEIETCPEGTCPIECGAHICCYDSNGIAVTSIRK